MLIVFIASALKLPPSGVIKNAVVQRIYICNFLYNKHPINPGSSFWSSELESPLTLMLSHQIPINLRKELFWKIPINLQHLSFINKEVLDVV